MSSLLSPSSVFPGDQINESNFVELSGDCSHGANGDPTLPRTPVPSFLRRGLDFQTHDAV
jgi:hypothetical protein